MIGPEGAADRVTAWLAVRLPVRLSMIRTRLELDRDTVPDPAVVLPYDKLTLGLEEWPGVTVVGQGLTDLKHLDTDPATGRELYRARYAVRAFAYLRADDELAATLLRSRYVLAIREALLERKTLTALPAYGAPAAADGIAIDPASVRESYSDLTPIADAATLAAAWLAVDVIVEETLDPVTPETAPADAQLDGLDAPGAGMTGDTANTVRVELAADADTADLPTHPAYS